MKVLLISENEKQTKLLMNAVNEAGNDFIHYRWFMKALDNLEEIAPEVIVVNAEDFPRHWKVLCQYSESPLFSDFSEPMKIVLYVPENFSKEDEEKAKILHVRGLLRKTQNETSESIREELFLIINGETGETMEETYTLYTVDNLIEDKDLLPTVDNLIEDTDYLATVDNLIIDEDKLYTVDNLFEGMEEYAIFGDDIEIEDITGNVSLSENVTEAAVENIVEKPVENSEAFETESVAAATAEPVLETEEAQVEETAASTESQTSEPETFDEELEIPTVSSLIGHRNPDDANIEKDINLLHEIQNVFSKNLSHKITEEDIQNEYTIYSVDNLFGLEQNDYNIKTVDDLFYCVDELKKEVPNTPSECKELMGSLLHRIMKYYAN